MAEIQTTQLETVKISALTEATTVGENDVTLVIQNGVTKKAKGNLFKGLQGKSIELQKTSTHIQWRQEGGEWTNLVALSDITGPAGSGSNVDLSSYATQSWVLEQIANIQGGGSVDLSGYALKSELHNHSNKAELDKIVEGDKAKWDAKSNFSGSYNDLADKPNSLPANGGNSDTVDGYHLSVLTQAEYDALKEKDPNTFYAISDASEGSGLTEEQATKLNSIGDVANLTTTNKSNLVAAVNENKSSLDSMATDLKLTGNKLQLKDKSDNIIGNGIVLPTVNEFSNDVFYIEPSTWGITTGLPQKSIEVINGQDVLCYSDSAYEKAYNNMKGIYMAIKHACNNGYKYIRFPSEEIALTYAYDILYFENLENVEIDLNGTTLKVLFDSIKRNPYDTTQNPVWHFKKKTIFEFRYCYNISMINGKIISDKIDRDFADANEKAEEGTYCILISQSKGALFKNLDLSHFMGDAIAQFNKQDFFATSATGTAHFDWTKNKINNEGQLEASETNRTSTLIKLPELENRRKGGLYVWGYGYSQGESRIPNKEYRVSYYDNNNNFICKLSSSVLRSVMIPKNATHCRLEINVDISEIENPDYNILISSGYYLEGVIIDSCFIHHGHRGGIQPPGNDLIIQNCTFWENGAEYDYEYDKPGFTQASGSLFMTRYHINMEDTKAYNTKYVNNKFIGGRIGIAIRSNDVTIENNIFIRVDSPLVLHRLNKALIKSNRGVGIDTMDYSNNRDWIIENNDFTRPVQIVGSGVVNSFVDNIVRDKINIVGGCRHFKNNTFTFENEFKYAKNSFIVLNTNIKDCVFNKENSLLVSLYIQGNTKSISNCTFKNLGIEIESELNIKGCDFYNCNLILKEACKFKECYFNRESGTLVGSWGNINSGNNITLNLATKENKSNTITFEKCKLTNYSDLTNCYCIQSNNTNVELLQLIDVEIDINSGTALNNCGFINGSNFNKYFFKNVICNTVRTNEVFNIEKNKNSVFDNFSYNNLQLSDGCKEGNYFFNIYDICNNVLVSPSGIKYKLNINDEGVINTIKVDSIVPVQSVSLDKTTATLKVDETLQLTPVITPSDATNQEITWEASNSNCTVVGGLVTAKTEGECVITCKTVDGNKTDTCAITVNAKDNIVPPSFVLPIFSEWTNLGDTVIDGDYSCTITSNQWSKGLQTSVAVKENNRYKYTATENTCTIAFKNDETGAGLGTFGQNQINGTITIPSGCTNMRIVINNFDNSGTAYVVKNFKIEQI